MAAKFFLTIYLFMTIINLIYKNIDKKKAVTRRSTG